MIGMSGIRVGMSESLAFMSGILRIGASWRHICAQLAIYVRTTYSRLIY
jgi:hypothetical protein